MKKTLIITTLCALSAFPAFAQEPTPTPAPAPEWSGWHHRGGMRDFWQSLTPEERQKLKSARQSAQSNPTVAAAREKLMADRKAYHDALSSAMIKTDPSLAPVLEKFKTAKEKAKATKKAHK